jgi:HTH-type transcriptional regulator / antitoxin HigA
MASKEHLAFRPDYAVAPGVTLLETIQSLGLSQAELAKRTDRPLKTINEIVKGKTAITPETALQLEHVLGVPASFWNKLERNYREALATIKESKTFESGVKWAQKFPIQELLKRKAILQSAEDTGLVRTMLQFFGVSSISAWKQVWTAPTTAYRRSSAFAHSPEATAAWLRLGEIEAKKLRLPRFNKAVFRKALLRIHTLMNAAPQDLKLRLIEECRKAGVAVVFVQELPKTCVHGAVRWIGDNPVIQLSCRYKVEDIFWFSFFHEAGHVILHGKREVFLEDDKRQNIKEKQADTFARNHLISEADWRDFIASADFLEGNIVAFAQSIPVPAGIVVGRLQHERRIEFAHFNYLKRRFDLTKSAAA